MDRKRAIREILDSLRDVHHMLESSFRPFLWHNDLTFSQMRILRTVKNSPGIGIKELATSLSITSSAATQQVDNLVRKGYLTRKANTEDRRSLNLRLSANLSNRLEEIETAFIEEMIGRFGVLSDDELAAYAELNRRIANTILEK